MRTRARRAATARAAGWAAAMLAMLPGTAAASSDDARAAALVDELGLVAAQSPVREWPRWRPPLRIVISIDNPARLDWLREVTDDTELIAVGSPAEAMTWIDTADAVIGFCDPALMARGADLRWVQIYSAGAEQCVGAARIRSGEVLLTNMQRSSSPEIAEHVMAMVLALARGLHRHIAVQTDGRWDPGLVPMQERWSLTGRKLLVVGLGGIGTEVARRAHGLGMRVTATRNSSRAGPQFVEYVGTAAEVLDLAREADVVVNSLPLTQATEGLIDAEFFRAMKPDAYFINVGRGRTVVTEDLVAALVEGRIAGAGLDVMDPEPLPRHHPLWKMPNVIITPHVAAGSDRILARMFLIVRENLRRYVHGEPMLSVVDPAQGY